jgi:hypothetical protein
MTIRAGILPCLLLAAATGAAAAPPEVAFAARRTLVEGVTLAYEKTIVLGILPDEPMRHHLEDKFVSHLRAKRLPAVTSHSLVPSLREPVDRDRVLAAIDAQKIDGAIVIRLVTMPKGASADEWNARWERGPWGDHPLRDLIQGTLDAPPETSKVVGVEVSLWDTRSGRPAWVARTEAIPRKEIEKSGGALIQQVIRALQDDHLLPTDEELDRRPRVAP